MIDTRERDERITSTCTVIKDPLCRPNLILGGGSRILIDREGGGGTLERVDGLAEGTENPPPPF